MDIEEKLVESVFEHKVLYDPSHKKYTDNNFKSIIWKEVALECGISSGDDAKDLWKKLRDGYRASMKRKRSLKGSGGASSVPSVWKYERQMSFLRPYMKERSRSSNLNHQIETIEDRFDEDVCSPTIVLGEEDDDIIIPNTQPIKKKKDNSILESLQLQPRRKEERSSERNEIERQSLSQPMDELKLFFDSMYAATKSLPKHIQRKVKRKVFNVVSEAEDQAENE